jgi:hypothetical protein
VGLDISVGDLVQLTHDDPEMLPDVQAEFERLQAALAAAGLAGYHEPHELPEEALVCSRIGPYGTLHFLRRIAAHLWHSNHLPAPADQDASNDPILEKCYQYLQAQGSGTGFDHLLYHSDCEGYYVPIDFARVVEAEDRFNIPGTLIGSSQRLLSECARLAGILELPLDLDPESDEAWSAAQEQGKSSVLWRRYGIESRVCLVLHSAASLSIRYGSALTFG